MKKYQKPSAEVVEFEFVNIIMTSEETDPEGTTPGENQTPVTPRPRSTPV